MGGNKGWFRGVIIIIICSATTVTASLNRTFFPQGFVFGVASSAYQYEGAVMEDGRGPSVWDTYAHKYPGKIKDGSNGDVAADSYHRYKEDVKIIKEMGLDAYRISFSWSRILPKGKLRAGVNWKGIRYYNHLINELIHSGIKPFVTLLHGDLPQALEDDYGGFLSTDIIFFPYVSFHAGERNGVRIGPKGVADGINIYPRGIKELLLHMRKKYMAKNLYITENGIGELNNSSLSLKEALIDTARIDYHYHHLSFLREAIQDGVDVRGYFAWSLLDNFEWGAGYTIRYGFNFVDFGKGLERHPKKSALWFKNFLKK